LTKKCVSPTPRPPPVVHTLVLTKRGTYEDLTRCTDINTSPSRGTRSRSGGRYPSVPTDIAGSMRKWRNRKSVDDATAAANATATATATITPTKLDTGRRRLRRGDGRRYGEARTGTGAVGRSRWHRCLCRSSLLLRADREAGVVVAMLLATAVRVGALVDARLSGLHGELTGVRL